MTMHLDDIFTGVTVRPAHDRKQYFIDWLRVFGIDDLPMVHGMRAQFTIAVIRPGKNPQRDFLRIGSADSDNREASLAWRRGNRCYGVSLVH